MKSPATPLPRPPCLGPGARTSTDPTGTLPMPVVPTFLAVLGCGAPTLRDRTEALMAPPYEPRPPESPGYCRCLLPEPWGTFPPCDDRDDSPPSNRHRPDRRRVPLGRGDPEPDHGDLPRHP